MLGKLKLIHDIEKYGLEHAMTVCERTLKTTTVTTCNGQEVSRVVMDMTEVYDVFEKRILKKIKGKH